MRSLSLLFASVLAVSSLHAQDGTLDAAFGTGGKVVTDIASGHDRAYDVRVQPDGKIVAAGYASSGSSVDIAVVRYNADGSIDGTFGTGGKVLMDFSGWDDYGYAVVTLSDILVTDSRIVVGGYAAAAAGNDRRDFALLRYNADGTLDATFGTGGTVTTDFAGKDDYGYALAQQPDGRLILAGHARDGSYDFGLVRYNPDGSLDATFGTGGKVMTDFAGGYDGAGALALLPGGKIVAAGWSANGATGNDFAIARYNANGSLDATFGTGGKVTTDFLGKDDRAYQIAVQPNGKLIVVGRAFNGTDNDFAIARYNKDGTLDATFGTGGKVLIDRGGDDQFSSVMLMSDGRIIAAGRSGGDFAIARFYANGMLDVTFGMGGMMTTDFSGGADAANAMDMQPDGKIVLAGTARGLSTGDDFALARYHNNSGVKPLICDDPSTVPSYAGGYVLNTAETKAFVKVNVPAGGRFFEFYATSNLVVEGVYADPDASTGLGAFTSADGMKYSFMGATPSPATVYFAIRTASPSNSRVSFFLKVTDACQRVMDVDPQFTLDAATEHLATAEFSARPNPAAGQTTLRFSLDEAGPVRLAVYDVLGREVAVVASTDFGAGEQAISLDASSLSSGLYVLRLEEGGRVRTQTLTIAR